MLSKNFILNPKNSAPDNIGAFAYPYFSLVFGLILFLLSALSIRAEETAYITPTFVRVITSPFEQYNDVNPDWSTDGEIISFERYDMNQHDIILANKDGKKLQTITTNVKKEADLDFLFSPVDELMAYNTGISWSSNKSEFVFVSSGKTGNFDLFIGKVGTEKTRRLTFHALKDNQAHWSPMEDNILFISARDGNAGLYMIDAQNGNMVQLLGQNYKSLHPVWSPDGKNIALMIGEEDSYHIYVINDINNPQESLIRISNNSHHNIRPSWSPDGNQIAYFSADENNRWNISITKLHSETVKEEIVATDVIQNSNKGPTWLPDSINIAYIKNEINSYNPIYIVDTVRKQNGLFLTNTKMNLDLSCSKNGLLVFQSQDRQWSRIFIAGIPGFKG